MAMGMFCSQFFSATRCDCDNSRFFRTTENFFPLPGVTGELCAFLPFMKQAVFIERDGVLNRAGVERNHQVSPLTLAEFRVNKDAPNVLAKLKSARLVLIVTTNQPGLSRGYQSRRELDRMHEQLRRTVPVDDILVCPHDEMDHCPCRKPKPGLLVEAAFKHQLDLDRSYVISNKWQDSEVARTAGCTSLMIQSPWIKSGHHDFVLSDLEAAVEKILQLQSSPRALAV
jgi:D-glycero-D-manno-heptose 1,7-bisphosphate phosphatase